MLCWPVLRFAFQERQHSYRGPFLVSRSVRTRLAFCASAYRSYRDGHQEWKRVALARHPPAGALPIRVVVEGVVTS